MTSQLCIDTSDGVIVGKQFPLKRRKVSPTRRTKEKLIPGESLLPLLYPDEFNELVIDAIKNNSGEQYIHWVSSDIQKLQLLLVVDMNDSILSLKTSLKKMEEILEWIIRPNQSKDNFTFYLCMKELFGLEYREALDRVTDLIETKLHSLRCWRRKHNQAEPKPVEYLLKSFMRKLGH